MKRTSFFNKVIAAGIILLAVFLLGALTGCGKDNEPGGGDNRKGEPYKFRVEISAQNTDVFGVASGGGNYTYVDESGLPRTEWYMPDDVYLVLSPHKIEKDVPRNFNSFMFVSRAMSINIIPNEEELKGVISGKLFVNNKLLVEFTNIYWWITTIAYDNKTKQYTVKTSDGKEFQTSKLD